MTANTNSDILGEGKMSRDLKMPDTMATGGVAALVAGLLLGIKEGVAAILRYFRKKDEDGELDKALERLSVQIENQTTEHRLSTKQMNEKLEKNSDKQVQMIEKLSAIGERSTNNGVWLQNLTDDVKVLKRRGTSRQGNGHEQS